MAIVVIGGALGSGTAAAFIPGAASAAIGALANAVACATTTACVAGANAASGPGVSGTSVKGSAITASGAVGLEATGTTGNGVRAAATNAAGVYGRSTSAEGVLGISTSGFGVRGSSNTSVAVIGSSGSSTGVEGDTSSSLSIASGVIGVSHTAGIDGRGVSGSAVSGAGVYGSSGCCYGVLGTTGNGAGIGVRGTATGGWGIYGDSVSSDGVFGRSNSGAGVTAGSSSGVGLVAQSDTNAAVDAETGGIVAIYGKAPNGNGAEISGSNIGLVGRSDHFPLYLSNLNGNLVFYVDGSGNVHYHGGLIAFVRAAGGGTVSAYGTQTTQPTVEDTGSAQLVNGAAAVRFDPAFSAAIDPRAGYRVFLTPAGETRGWLFVATKTASGFVVREGLSGRSNVSFDYRIVATALGQSAARMTVTAGPLPADAPSAPLRISPVKPNRPVPPLPVFARPAAAAARP